MAECRDEAVAAVNGYFDRIRANRALDARLSLVMFDSRAIDSVRDRLPADACPPLRVDDYRPEGATPLLDAVGYSAGLLDCLSVSGERRIMAVLTDGLENASREYTRDDVRALLSRKQADHGWLVLYLGAGHDAEAQACQIGIAPQNTADISFGALGEVADVLDGLGQRFLAPRRGAGNAAGFSPFERRRLMAPSVEARRRTAHRFG